MNAAVVTEFVATALLLSAIAFTSNPALIIGAFAVLCVGIVSSLSLRGWRDWIALKHAELESMRHGNDAPVPSATSHSGHSPATTRR
jgi:hypothetical protein